MSMRTLVIALSLVAASLAFSQNCIPPKQTTVVAYRAGTMFQNIGTSDIPITSASDKTKALIRQGFALIHCYWPNEAIRTFREATVEDPTCAMAWCGLNIALTQPWFYRGEYAAEAEYAIKKAIANIDPATDAEQDMIRAFRVRALNKDERDTDFEKSMDALVKKFPKLDEPRLVWAGLRAQRCMNTNYLPTGDVRGDLAFVAKLIEPVLKRSPESPGALHYWIHAMEPASPFRAEKAADTLLRVATGSPHLQHMPGHIYNRIGRYTDGHKAFSIAKGMDEAMAKQFGISAYDADWQYYHNVSFAALNLLEAGRINEAIDLAKITDSVKQDIAVRTGDWKNAYDAKQTVGSPGVYLNLCEGRVALAKGDIAGAKASLAKTDGYFAKGEPVKTGGDTPYRTNFCQMKELAGLIAFAENDTARGITLFEESLRAFDRMEYDEPVILIQTPHESYGHALIKAGKFDDAVKVFQRGLKLRPRSGWLLYGIGLARESAGKQRDAEKAYKEFLKEWAQADKDRPEVQRAESFLATTRSSRT